MSLPEGVRSIASRLGRADKIFLITLAGYGVSLLLPVSSFTRLILSLAATLAGTWVALKWARVAIQKVIWRLRNRLIVAYLFIALVPILLIGTLAYVGMVFIAAQTAVYLVSAELDHRIQLLNRSAAALARAAPDQRDDAWRQVQTTLGDRFSGAHLLIRERGAVRFTSATGMDEPPAGYGEISGVVVKDGLLYSWARAVAAGTDVTIMAPLDQQFFTSLAPGFGSVSILQGELRMRLHRAAPADIAPAVPVLPAPTPSRLSLIDADLHWGVNIPVAVWETPPRTAEALLSVRSKLSSLFEVITSREAEGANLLGLLYLIAIGFLIVELVAFYIGISLTRSITTAFSSIYEGTERVRSGDFSHRIKIRGSDQLATVGRSFNRMAENLERLVIVAKENERIQAELEIAREVQRQLYPKNVPALRGLELRAHCVPARMVSGDYYDYQTLQQSCACVAIGDVAGKGISAALLMATLQSSLRTQVRASVERTLPGVDSGSTLSTSRLVRQLNEQLYADTAPEKYATFLFSVYNDDIGQLTYTNAGHLPPVLIRGREATLLEVNGMVVGAFPFAQYGESQLRLEPGDLLVCYTDGVTEPENAYGELFGEARLIDNLLRHAHRDTDHIITAVVDAIREWTGSPELQDDMTLLIARRH